MLRYPDRTTMVGSTTRFQPGERVLTLIFYACIRSEVRTSVVNIFFFVSLELCWNRRRNYSHPLINYPVLILKIISRSWNLNTSFSPEFYSSVDSFLPPLFFFVRCIYNLQRQSSSGKYISIQMLNIFIFFLIRILRLVWLLVDVADRCSVK